MPEYITKERAMDCVYEAFTTDANAQDLYAIRRKIAKEPGIGWVSVKDRMPEFPCITYDIHGNMDYCKTGIVEMCIDSTWYACTEGMVHLEEVLHPNKNTAAMVKGNRITHWMPLPPRPEEVNEDA